MRSIDQRALSWRRSSACASGECVEVAYWKYRIFIRNSALTGTVLEVAPSAWQALLTDVAMSPGFLGSDYRARPESTGSR